MKLLVTGGAGYIGSAVTASLIEAGHDVTVLDDLSTGHADAVPPKASFVHGTLRDDAAPVLPKGTVIHVVAWHDNTAANRNNPDPNQWVGWGDRTVDEMAHAWVNVTYISEADYQEWVAKHNPKKSAQDAGDGAPKDN